MIVYVCLPVVCKYILNEIFLLFSLQVGTNVQLLLLCQFMRKEFVENTASVCSE